jgi:phenylalanyl-tRNA synthetase beta chain
MNALVSYQWLKEFVDLKESPVEFAARVSLSGPAVERLYPQDVSFDRIVVGHIVSVDVHPNADKLRVAKVDVGGAQAPLTIVCGGSNLRADQWVIVSLIGAKVRWHGEGDLIELVPTAIRGVNSEGMICAAEEVGLGEAFPSKGEREIVDLGAQLPGFAGIPGQPLAEALGYTGDVVMDMEVTSNRPDAMGMVGMAREAAAILERPFLWQPAPEVASGTSPLKITIEDSKRCLRYRAVRIDGIKIGPSPWWMQRRLIQAGLHPINNVVDITNYVLLELGQPMHAFDASKLEGDEIRVRTAKAGETIELLNGTTGTLTENMLVIADAKRPIAVAGVMGGKPTSITEATTSVIFEAATFDAVSIRRTARALHLSTDAQLRYEKGLSIQALPAALARSVQLCLQLAGGTVSSQIFDQGIAYEPRVFSIPIERMQTLIGITLSQEQMVETLTRLGFNVRVDAGVLTAFVPWWRDQDIEDGRDLVEEVARVYGYAHIPPVFPAGVSPRPTDPILRWEDRLRDLAVSAGYTETYSYSFVSRELLAKTGYESLPVLAVNNPLSVDLEVMRPSLLPSLLQVVSENQERAREQYLFEIAHIYHPRSGELPTEHLHLAAAIFHDDRAWREAKGFVEHLCQELHVKDLRVIRLENDPHWHPGRSFEVWSGSVRLGVAGELHPQYAEAWKLEGRLAFVDLDIPAFISVASTNPSYIPVSAYPEVRRDLALLVQKNVSVEALEATMRKATTLLQQVEWFDTYTGTGVEAGKKSVAFHLTFISQERTLEAKEVDEAMNQITTALQATHQATRR